MKHLFAYAIALFLCVLLLNPSMGFAQRPRTLSYQGILTDSQQEPITNGTYTLTFSLYSTANGGTPLWTEVNQVQTQIGVFDAVLGQFTPITLPFDQQYWLGITLQGKPEMTPRIALVAAPYAMNALQSSISSGLTPNATGAVLSLNNLAGNLTIQGTGATSITQAGNTLTIASEQGIHSLTAEDNSIVVNSGNGAATTLRAGIIPLKNIAGAEASANDILRFDGTNWKPAKETTYSGSSAINVQGQIISLASQNATTGQVLKWNGTAWLPATDENSSYTAGAGIALTGNQFSALTTGGDLSGAHTNATVTGLVGKKILATTLLNGQVLAYNQSSNSWQPTFVDTNPNDDMLIGTAAGGDLAGTYPNPAVANGAITNLKLGAGSVTTEKIADGQVTLAKLAPGIIPTSLPPSGAAGGDLSGTYPNPTVANIQGKAVSSTAPSNGQVLSWNGTTNKWEPSAAGSGSVTSVGLTLPSIFSVTGSPITTAGTLSASLATQNQNLIFASPDGATGAPVFRAITANDLPTIPISKGGTGATTATAGLNNLLPAQTGNSGKVLQTDGTNTSWIAAANGSVTSVGLTLPSIFSVSGSPITTAGTLSASLATQTQNLIFASPDGATGAPIFRAITANDLPTIPISKGGTGATTATAGLNNLLPAQTGNSGKVLQTDGTNTNWVAAANGSVTSVGLTLPSIFSVSGSPITTAGTLSASLASQNQNLIFASPDGATGAPVFRAITANDLPTIAITKGGTGATTANGALTNLLPTQTGNSGKVLQTDGTNTSWVAAANGSVTSVGLSLPSIFSVSGSPITTAGTLSASLASQNQNLIFASPDGATGAPVFRAITANDLPTIAIAKGGTGATTATAGLNNLLPAQTGNSGKVLQTDGTNTSWVAGANGSVTSVGLALPSIFSVTGSPITSAGTLSASLATQNQNLIFASPDGATGAPVFRAITANDLPTIPISKGGTGATTATAGLNNLLPVQTGNSGKVLQTDGTNTSWVATANGSVTSVGLSLPSIFSVSGSPITTAGTLSASLATQTQNLIFASPDGATGAPVFRAIAANDLPTIPISKGGTGGTTATVGLNNLLPAQTGNSGKVLQTDGTNTSWVAAANGSVTSVGLSLPSIFSVSGSPITSAGTLSASLATQNQNLIFASPDGATGAPVFRAITANDLPTIAVAKGGTGATTANAGLNNLLPTQTGNSGKVLQTDGTNTSWVAAANGSVTSVGLTLPSIFSVSGSPITTAGTLSASLASQNQNLIFASPDGATGAPVFRAITANDLPTIAITKGGTGATTATAGLNNLLPVQTGNSGKVLQTDGTNTNWVAAANGSVTSVGLSLPTIFDVSGSPITSAGTLSASLASQNQNLIFASPDGATGAPVFRAITANDLPTIAITKGGTGATTATAGLNNLLPVQTGNSGKMLQTDGTNTNWVAAANGSVTSVGLSLPTIFDVSGSPITSAGTLSASLASQNQNLIFASPDGATGAPVFRAIAANDLPTIPISKGGTGATTATAGLNNLLPVQTGNSGKVLQTDGTNTNWVAAANGSVTSVGLSLPSIFSVSGSPITSAGTLSASLASQTQNLIFASPDGATGAPVFRAITANDLPTIAITKGGTGATTANGALTNLLPTQTGNSGKVLQTDGTNTSWIAAANGSVTSVGLSLPSIFSVSGSPITTAGTLSASLASQNQNLIFASPDGATGAPVFRAITANDLPTIPISKGGTGGTTATVGLNNLLPVQTGNSGKVLQTDGTNTNWVAAANGSVTSVGLSLPTIFDVSGSPITSAGTLSASLASQNQNLIFASPDGATGAPVFRAIAANDLPTIPISKGGTGATTATAGLNNLLPVQTGNSGKVLQTDGTNTSWVAAANGSVTSVGLSLPSIFSVSGSPITTTGTLSASLASQNQNLIFASPDGATGAPVFRAIAANDLPTIPISKGGTGATTATAGLNNLLPVQTGNSGKVLQTDGTNTNWVAAYGGLVNFTESVNSSTPNSSKPVVQFLATNAASSTDIALTPKGLGSLTAQIADNTSAGGNKRGNQSVDWQMVRAAASQVASGSTTFIGGGSNNTASGTSATVVAGNTNAAGGSYSFIGGGNANTTAGTNDVITGGSNNSTTGTGINVVVGGGVSNVGGGSFTVIGGGGTNTTGGNYAAVGGGNTNTATGNNSAIIGGAFNNANASYSAILGGSNMTISAAGSGSVGFNSDTTGGAPMSISTPKTVAFANNNLWLANNTNTPSELRFFEAQVSGSGFPAAGTNYTSFKAGAQSADISYTLPTAQGSANTYLKNDGSGNLSWGSSGLVNFTESANSTAPNTTTPVAQFLATGGATNIDVALTPKGNGALVAQIPNSAASGGDKRGTNAVDWQTSRTTSAQVASGNNSSIGGGLNNTANGLNSNVHGGTSNTASGQNSSVGGGSINTATSTGSTISGGNSNLASNSNTTIGGGNGNVASGTTATVGGGDVNTAGGLNSTVSGGSTNSASATGSTVGGGTSNTANSALATVSGGNGNTASGGSSTVAGGRSNTASGAGSFVGGGGDNGAATSGNTASGAASSILGGYGNSNAGDYSSILGGRGLTLGATADRVMGFHANNAGGSSPMTIDSSDAAVFGNANLWLANTNNTATELRFYEAQSTNGAFPAAGTNFTSFKAGAMSANVAYTLPTAQGSANTFLKNDGSGNLSWGSTGLQNFIESVNSSTPNAGIPVVQLAPNNAGGSVDISIAPKGSGSLLAQIPDNTATGGNKRGSWSVDFQMIRASATQVASGTESFLGSGNNNTVSGFYSGIVGGVSNTVSSNFSFVGGGSVNNISGGSCAIAGGDHNTISGAGTNNYIGGGYFHSASGSYVTIGGGNTNSVSGNGTTVSGGTNNGAAGSFSAVGGGSANVAQATGSVIPGGTRLQIWPSAGGTFGFNGDTTGYGMNMTLPGLSIFGNTTLALGGTDGVAHEFRYYEAQSGSPYFPANASINYTAFKAGSQSSDITYTLPTAQGGANTFLKNDGSGVLSWGSPSSLVNFTESVNSAAPNATTPVVQLLATNAATNVDIALSAKGSGALTAQIANNASSGGNKRGTNAVDWQSARSSASQVASGSFATVSGGYQNTASGSNSTVGGGNAHVASGSSSTVGGGNNNTASNSYATIAGGNANTASEVGTTIGGGYSNTASNIYTTIAGGYANSTISTYASVGGGLFNAGQNSYATIAGGHANVASGIASFVGGGGDNGAATGGNSAGGISSAILGGFSNVTDGDYSSILGGRGLTFNSAHRSIGFHANNSAGSLPMTISASDVAVFGNTNLWLANNKNTASELRFYEAQNSSGTFPVAATNYTAFKAGTQSADITYTLPPSQGGANSLLTNDGSGGLTWGKKILQLLNQAVDCANLTADGGTAYVDVAVTGAVVGSTVNVSPRGDMEDGIVIASARVSAADNVRIKFVNSGNGAINPAAVNFDITVIQP